MPIFPAILALAAASAPHLTAVRASAPPVLDGHLDDAAWQRAPASSAFTQKLPEGGKSPKEPTSVRVVYDADAIYVGIDCVQRASEIIGRLTRRDRDAEADSVSVALDTRSDGKSAFEFSVNAAGVLSDGLRFNDTDYSHDWDENWEASVTRTPSGWSAEIRIPIRALRFSARPSQSWGIQVRRYTSETQELDELAYIPRSEAGEVSRYGRLDGLVGLRSKAPIELRPFVAFALRNLDPEGATLARGLDPLFSAGLDLKWHVSQALTLDATFLPDFGQVEADQVVLNLTTFELYFPEKRPFFLEGAETFSTPLPLLYTRRIGRAPGEPSLRYGEQLIREPVPSTIFGAEKLVGEIGGRFQVGELVALTGRQTVDARAPSGATVPRLADPLTAYKVLRIKRELGTNGHVGLIAMSTNRLESAGLIPPAGDGPQAARGPILCPSGDELARGPRCYHDAYVGGIDARFRSPSGDYVASGQVVGTLIQNGPPRTLADGTVIGSGDAGPVVNASFAKEAGTIAFAANYEGHGSKADYNDLGYMQRQNQHHGYVRVTFRNLEPWRATLETRVGVEAYENDTLDLLNLQRGVQLFNSTRFKNFWSVFSGVHARAAHFDDREMGDGAALERGAQIGVESWVSTDSRGRVSAELWSALDLIEGGFSFQGDGRLSFRILPQFDVDLLPSWLYTAGEPRYAGIVGGDYLFGKLRAQSLGLTLRSTYTFTPRLTLQAYAQAFLDAGGYEDLSLFPARGKGAIVRRADLRAAPVSIMKRRDFVNPDFQSGTLNASLVLRWEYRLGSTFYVVYTHAQSSSVTPVLGEGAGIDLRRASPRAAEDDLLVKLSFWWGG
jgi:Domain of unknown function (DUF5916)/Carbohydrate family 9 binding domain-like